MPARRLELSAPADPAHEHLAELDASAGRVLVLQADAAGAGPPYRLVLSPADHGEPRRPTGAVAVLPVDGRLGAFALE
ncbi:hypothetical protein [Nannocystis sp. SCPEA4]|uniref:hypothetical protein n=1 Tax=Nannocystis sp. SCPEA4 TaxID=2996787 RepID=UPI00226F6E87|nr:hypothetical protein [Nannocystis sp. SCPEA4]MCY1061512.1 hypothetical protein [Nannocystis sp. SCPEA4]